MRVTDHMMRQFAAAYVNSSGDMVLAYRLINPQTKTDKAAEKGARRMLERAEVQQYIEQGRAKVKAAIGGVSGHLSIHDGETDKLSKAIGLTEIQLINEYIGTALLDHLDYYDDNGQPKPLQSLSVEQRRQIKEIDWYPEDSAGRRRIRDYVLEDRDKARDQLAKITGIVNPAFDFAGLIAILTGKGKAEAAEELRRLNHSEGVNFDAIAKRAGIIEGEFTEVKA